MVSCLPAYRPAMMYILYAMSIRRLPARVNFHALGANVAAVKAQLGHSSLNTTALYVHATSYSADRLPL